MTREGMTNADALEQACCSSGRTAAGRDAGTSGSSTGPNSSSTSGRDAAPGGGDGHVEGSVAPTTSGTSGGSSSIGINNPMLVQALAARLEKQAAIGGKQGPKSKYAFWETQPVVQFNEDDGAGSGQVTGGGRSSKSSGGKAEGPIDAPRTVADVRREPYALPDSFEWCECDLREEGQVQEVHQLLGANYVEDDDNMFRFNYSSAFLAWALHPPGYQPSWHLGVRVAKSHKLVAFISAIPASVAIRAAAVAMVEINFLCVHKKLRSRRLAPVLIKEITRRVNLRGIWQAVYTAGVVLPKPVGVCRYYHRPLNPRKLIDVGFSRLAPRMTMARTLKLLRLPEAPATPGIRPMRAGDAPAVTALLQGFLSQFQLAQRFSTEEVEHWFTPRPDVVETFVVESPSTGQLTDLVSFYALPSTILGHATHTELKAAYMFYTVPGATKLCPLMQDALILAKARGYDVFNALDLMHNEQFLKDLKFGIGDGQLRYYLYNWRLRHELDPPQLGMILL